MSGKISNANIAECSDSYRRKGYTALVSRRSTQNLNLMLADGKYKFRKEAYKYKHKYKAQIQSTNTEHKAQIQNTKYK